MLKKLVSILFEEEEITIEEDLNETPVSLDIPKLEPMSEKKKPIVIEDNHADEPIPVETNNRKSMMIDVDVKVQETVLPNSKPAPTPLVKPDTKYHPKDIISPIFGGPKNPSEPIETKTYTQVKTRQPLTEIISPMFGKVDKPEQSSSMDASLMEIDLDDMLSPIEEGTEVQASLFDYLEGISNDEE